MRLLLAIFCLLTVTIAANADVVKPINTFSKAKSLTRIAFIDFDYSVADRGWSPRDQTPQIGSTKQFLIDYVQTSVTSEDASHQTDAVAADAKRKCAELRLLEATANPTLILDAKIADFRTREYKNEFFGTYVCLVSVTASPTTTPAAPPSYR